MKHSTIPHHFGPTRELNGYLRMAGLEHLRVDEAAYPQISNLDDETRARLAAAVRQTLQAAQRQAPAISQWDAEAEHLILSDDGSPVAQDRQDRFWRAISTVLFAVHALIRLGDLEVFPLLIEMADSMPGHPQELAIEVLRRYVDPGGSLGLEELVRQAQAWWRAKTI